MGAWKWFQKNGVSSGGDYADRNSSASCKPYPFPSCAHHVTPEEGQVACNTLPMFQTPKCTTSCEDKDYDVSYKADKHYAKSFYVRSPLLVLCCDIPTSVCFSRGKT